MEFNVNIDQILSEQKELGHTNIVDVECELTESDYRNYFFYTRIKKDRWLIPAIIALYSVFIIFEIIGTLATALYGFVFFAFGTALLVVPLLNWRGYKIAAGGDKDVRIAVSPAGIYIEDYTNDSNGIYAWEDIDRVRETGKLYLFYLNPESAVIIPKRALSAVEKTLVEQYAATV